MSDTRLRSHDTAPDPDDPRKPDGPSDLHRRAWRYAAKQSLAEFRRDECTDQAAALTYYAVLSLFPALLAVVSLLGVFGQGESTAEVVLQLIRDIGQEDAAEQLRDPVLALTQSDAAGIALITGVLGALWSASGYVGAFGRAMNRIYEVPEGRPFWKLRPINVAITLVAVVLAGLVLLGLVVTGPFAREVGDAIGVGDTTVTVWNIAKWPVLLAVVMGLVAFLYWATPNVRQPKFRWLSVGAGLAIVVWIVASLGFSLYVATFGSYNATYGSLAGIIIFLLWLWLTNVALLFGAEVDAELERSRELQAGLPAEETIQLPVRDDRRKDEETRREEIAQGRALREEAAGGDRSEDGAEATRRRDG